MPEQVDWERDRKQLQEKGQIGLVFVLLRISKCRERCNSFFNVKVRSFCLRRRNGCKNTGFSRFYVGETIGTTYKKSFLRFSRSCWSRQLLFEVDWVGTPFSQFVYSSHKALYVKGYIWACRTVPAIPVLKIIVFQLEGSHKSLKPRTSWTAAFIVITWDLFQMCILVP